MTDARTLVMVIPHWPIIAAGVAYNCPAAVTHMNRVVDATPAAVEHGVVAGIRRREAQRLCPDLEMIDNDEAPLHAARQCRSLFYKCDNILPPCPAEPEVTAITYGPLGARGPHKEGYWPSLQEIPRRAGAPVPG